MAVAPHSADGSVRLELRHGNGRPTVYTLAGAEFLIGSVPGCDLRLTGSNLPPIACVITRQADGVRIRKLAPTLPLLHNGQPFSAAELQSGDLLTLGPMSILVAIEADTSYRPTSIEFAPIPLNPPAESEPPPPERGEIDGLRNDLTAQRRELYRRY